MLKVSTDLESYLWFWSSSFIFKIQICFISDRVPVFRWFSTWTRPWFTARCRRWTTPPSRSRSSFRIKPIKSLSGPGLTSGSFSNESQPSTKSPCSPPPRKFTPTSCWISWTPTGSTSSIVCSASTASASTATTSRTSISWEETSPRQSSSTTLLRHSDINSKTEFPLRAGELNIMKLIIFGFLFCWKVPIFSIEQYFQTVHYEEKLFCNVPT